MKSDIIRIDNQGHGFQNAVAETKKVAAYQSLDARSSLRLELITEEMLSLARSVTGEMQASFWLEATGRSFELHMMTKTVMDKEKRQLLISSTSSRKNEAAKSLLGHLRDAFEQAMAAEPTHPENDLPVEILSDLVYQKYDDPEWDGYERSVLRRLADDVKIAIRGGLVDMTVCKTFE